MDVPNQAILEYNKKMQKLNGMKVILLVCHLSIPMFDLHSLKNENYNDLIKKIIKIPINK